MEVLNLIEIINNFLIKKVNMKKEQTFDEILTSVLETYESNPNQNLDSLISDECNKYGSV